MMRLLIRLDGVEAKKITLFSQFVMETDKNY